MPYFLPENKFVLTHTLKRWAKLVRPSGAGFSALRPTGLHRKRVLTHTLKPAFLSALNGTTEKAAEKLDKAAKNSPQALMRNSFSTTYGTTEVVPFPKTCVNQSFSASC